MQRRLTQSPYPPYSQQRLPPDVSTLYNPYTWRFRRPLVHLQPDPESLPEVNASLFNPEFGFSAKRQHYSPPPQYAAVDPMNVIDPALTMDRMQMNAFSMSELMQPRVSQDISPLSQSQPSPDSSASYIQSYTSTAATLVDPESPWPNQDAAAVGRCLGRCPRFG